VSLQPRQLKLTTGFRVGGVEGVEGDGRIGEHDFIVIIVHIGWTARAHDPVVFHSGRTTHGTNDIGGLKSRIAVHITTLLHGKLRWVWFMQSPEWAKNRY
jgi:hypothetical protein